MKMGKKTKMKNRRQEKSQLNKYTEGKILYRMTLINSSIQTLVHQLISDLKMKINRIIIQCYKSLLWYSSNLPIESVFQILNWYNTAH